MRYVDEIVNYSNDELEFAKQLLKVKENIENGDSYKEVKLLERNLKKFCEKEIENSMATNDDYILLNTNHFSMFILERLINKMSLDSSIHEETMKDLLRVNNLEKWVKDKLKERYVNNILLCLEHGFVANTGYSFELMDQSDDKICEVFNKIFTTFNFKIINEILDNKTIIFVGKKGKQSATLTGLNILLINLKDFLEYDSDGNLNVKNIIGKIINNLTEIVVTNILDEILMPFDIQYLCNKYTVDEDSLKMCIGVPIANAIAENEHSEVLDTILELVKKAKIKEAQIEKRKLYMAKPLDM